MYLFDADEYADDRGMIFPLDEILSGEISENFAQLMSSLSNMIKNENDVLRKPSKLFFKYDDNDNTKRFVEHVLEINGKI